jgi:hypothetical protein
MMKVEIPFRRIMLRGASVVGCGLWVLIVLSGCDSMKGATLATAAPASPPATSANPAAPAATRMVSQPSVQYLAQPKGAQKSGSSLNFIAESNTFSSLSRIPASWSTARSATQDGEACGERRVEPITSRNVPGRLG